jgi:hypothetical protein
MRNPLSEVRSGRTMAVALLLAWAQAAGGQTFSSGSTEADGIFDPPPGTTQNITVKAGGVYHYKTYNVPANTTVEYFRGPDNAPVVILATGNVTISGTVTVRGLDGVSNGQSNHVLGAQGGPGGFRGGNGGVIVANPPVNIQSTAGQGPGGGAVATSTVGGFSGNYGAPTSFSLLTPLFGGSGGGGGFAVPGGFSGAGASGGGGGGAILVASSSRITVNGAIRANGGAAGANINSACRDQAGSGSGGAVRLVAPTIDGIGQVQAVRGPYGGPNCGMPLASDGRIRIEAFTLSGFSGTVVPTPSVANAPGPVSPAGNPALANVPTLQFASIGTPPQPIPTTQSASYSTPDVTLPAGTTGSVPVVLSATNTPVGPPTVITVRLIPQGVASSVTVVGTNHTGTFASSSATVDLPLTTGVTVLQAHAAMNLIGQTASLFPLIDGEPVERVMVAAAPGESSSLSLVTKSGKERRLDEMSIEDQLRVARAWEAMRETRTE